MLLLRLCAKVLSMGLVADPSPFTEPSALLLNPWVVGETNDTGVTVVWPVCGAFAAAMLI